MVGAEPYNTLVSRGYSWLIDPLVSTLHHRVAEICAELKPENVLDIASATGEQCRLLDKLGIPAVGLDLAKAMVAYARRRSPDRIRFVHGSALDLPFPKASFNCVLLVMALHEHPQSERDRMLQEARRVLRPGGTMFLADYGVPKGGSSLPGWLFITLIERFAGREHFRNFRGFVKAGGVAALTRECSLPVSKRYTIYRGAIQLFVVRSVGA